MRQIITAGLILAFRCEAVTYEAVTHIASRLVGLQSIPGEILMQHILNESVVWAVMPSMWQAHRIDSAYFLNIVIITSECGRGLALIKRLLVRLLLLHYFNDAVVVVGGGVVATSTECAANFSLLGLSTKFLPPSQTPTIIFIVTTIIDDNQGLEEDDIASVSSNGHCSKRKMCHF